MGIAEIIRQAVTVDERLNQIDLTTGLHIGFGIDAAFARPLGVTITSIIVNNPQTEIIFHVFASTINEEDLQRLHMLESKYDNIKLLIYRIDDSAIAMLPTQFSYSLATYFRLMMPIILPGLKNLLYLDADIICLQNLNGLFGIDMSDSLATVIQDVDRVAEEKSRELELKYKKYFNAGVMCINITKWNEARISEQAIEILASSPGKYSLLDQDVLNILMDGKVKWLPRQFNFMPPKKETPALDLSDVILLHCANIPKPWKEACNSVTQQYFLHYQEVSPWAGTPLIMPTYYQEARRYAYKMWHLGNKGKAVYWMIQYIIMKFKEKWPYNSLKG